MIELTDLTLRETKGDFKNTYDIMESETSGEWMLVTDAFISNRFISTRYLLHLWRDGKIVIFDTDRPMSLDSPDDDLQELSQWCKINEWKGVFVHDRLLTDKRGFDYWQRAFRAGLVESEKLRLEESQEVERLMKAYLKDKEEKDAFETDN